MKIAKIISRILDPLVILGALTVVAIFQSGLRGAELLLFLTAFVLGSVLLPAGLLWWAIQNKKIGNWDITNRKQRFLPLTILIACLSIDLGFAFFLHNSILISLFSLYTAYLVGFFVITMFWKISGHTGAVSLATGLVIMRYGWHWWPVLFLVPLVAWARVVGKYHTLGQVIAGVIYAVGLLCLWSQFIV